MTYIYKDKEYASLSKLCEAYNVTYQNYRYRISHGWTMGEALEDVPRIRRESIHSLCVKYHVARIESGIYKHLRDNQIYDIEEIEKYIKLVSRKKPR
jgi:hypothetical protein